MFDYSKFKGLMAEKGTTQKKLSTVLGISQNAVSHKMNGTSDFTPREIVKLCEFFGIPNTQVGAYFFTIKV